MQRSRAVRVAALIALVILAGTSATAAPNPIVELKVAGRGRVLIELYQKDAPKTVAQFLRLSRNGFYKGILFHRVRPGFVAQAGDPGTRKLKAKDLIGATDNDGRYQQLGIGGGGSGRKIPFEYNNRRHEPGTLSMGLSGPRSDTADSQFFIDLVRNRALDGDYCVFGRVIEGMDVVQRIQQGDRIEAVSVTKPAPRKTKA